MNHKAIFALYPQVVTVDDTEGAFDAEGNKVEIDLEAVSSWIDPNQYKLDRAMAYPSIQEQLDMQYWDTINGTTTWKDAINSVKQQFPKGEL